MKKIFFSVFTLVIFSFVVSCAYAAGGANSTNLRAVVSYAVSTNGAKAGIAVSWNPQTGIAYELRRFKQGVNDVDKIIQLGGVSGNPYLFTDRDITMNAAYYYRLLNKTTGETIAQTDPINLVPKTGGMVSGAAWGAWPNGSNAPYGIGWISDWVNSRDVKSGVFVDSDGLLHGTMWSNLYGWLSFNKEDLGGCPMGTCEARAENDGKISGWARFTNKAGDNTSSWGGWVNLRGDAGDGGQYGTCFGAANGEEKTVSGITYYTGAGCAGDGISNHSLNGVGWASGEIGGWIVFGNAEGLVGGEALTISPLPPHRVAIRDYKNFSANLDVKWFVNNKWGGDGLYGTVSPNESGADEIVAFRGPNALPNPAQVTLSASTTDPLNPRNVETEVTIVPPYDIGCASEGDTSIRVFINKNYFDPNYQKANPHTAELFTDTKQVEDLGTFLIETKGPEYAHTKLKQKTTYYYQLRTTFGDGYRIKTQTISCKTGETIPLGSATALSAFSNSSARIYVNWKDNSRSLAPYEFEVQRMQLTPNPLFDPKFNPQSDTSVEVSWTQKTDTTPYEQKLMRSEDSEGTWKLINTTRWSSEMPPAEPASYSYSDENVALGRPYQYKLETCSLVTLDETMYSQPIKGGVAHPSRSCVTSEVVQYLHQANNGNQASKNVFSVFTASLFSSVSSIAEKVSNSLYEITNTLSQSISRTYISFTNLFRKDKIDIARGASQTGDYSAYFKTAVVTKSPVFVDDERLADTIYLYRVSILSENPQWSNLRAAKTMTDNRGGQIENRPICMRNSFCDSSVSAVRNGEGTESSEQQCFVNKDCVNVGRSDQGYQER